MSFFIICLSLVSVQARQRAFTYQGTLADNGSPVNDNYDLQFGLFDCPTDGAQVGTAITVPNVSVSAGIFTVTLDFGAGSFNGTNRFLEIGAWPSGAGPLLCSLLDSW